MLYISLCRYRNFGSAAIMLSALSAVSVRLNDTDAFTALLDSKSHPLIYDGIEPSSRMTLSQGLLKASHIKQLVASGFHYTIWVADWFAFVNNKLNADLKKIQTVAKYFTEVFRNFFLFFHIQFMIYWLVFFLRFKGVENARHLQLR